MPRRGGSLSLSTCSPAQRATTWICADSVTTVCFPTTRGMAFSTPRINSRGCRQPCICTGFLLAEPRPPVFVPFFSGGAKWADVSRSGPSPESPQRIQSNRASSTPAAARDSGSRESETSTNAHASCRSVAWASNENARLVRPEEAGPHNSTKDPRGKPPPSTASSSATPLGWSSATERLWNPSRPRPMKASYRPGFREGAIMGRFAFCSPTLILIRWGERCQGTRLWKGKLLGRPGEPSFCRIAVKTAVSTMYLRERMSKRIDFAKQRRDQGRSLSTAVRELTAMIEPVAHQHGIDLRAILGEALARKEEEKRLLTERLQESVVPLFINRDGQPDRIGSCVLVRLDSEFYAFTAAHVIKDAGSAPLFAPSEGRGGKLQPLPPFTAHLKSSGGDNDLDVGVLALPPRRLGAFQQHLFLAGAEIDQDNRPDDQDDLRSFYFVLGYSASRTQLTVSRAERRIHQQSFRC